MTAGTEREIETEVDEQVEDVLEDERKTSYLELFFDLVFVFAITQVASLILSDTSAAGFARSVLILTLIWWGWSGFAWMTNAIDIDDVLTRWSMLLAMAATFFMAFAVPAAYGDDGAWFGTAYFAVSVLNVFLYMRGARFDPELRSSVARLGMFFLIGPSLVLIGGFLGDPWRVGLWIAGVVVTLLGALDAGGRVWRVSAAHFAERHALFVIIALGESIVAIGTGALGDERTVSLAAAILVAFAGVAALWWAYFDFIAGAVERALRKATDPRIRGRIARDVFTFGHFPMILGIVFFAVAAKKAVAHGDEPMSAAGRFALGVGLTVYLLAFVAGRYRVTRTIAWERATAAGAIALLAWLVDDVHATVLIALTVGVLAVALAVEARRLREVRLHIRSDSG